MRKFEYKILYLSSNYKESEEVLNSYGAEGWEAVGVSVEHDWVTIIVKRPL